MVANNGIGILITGIVAFKGKVKASTGRGSAFKGGDVAKKGGYSDYKPQPLPLLATG